ncbi:hypothetical protein PRLR6025_15010 [Prevotella lacticifex]|nr:hypothetical protein PRLR6025_15010 [Prevotella lacticifex]
MIVSRKASAKVGVYFHSRKCFEKKYSIFTKVFGLFDKIERLLARTHYYIKRDGVDGVDGVNGVNGVNGVDEKGETEGARGIMRRGRGG